MNLKIKNVSRAYIEAADQPNQIDISIEGLAPESLLNHVDILTAVNYYGITEFLDIIGEDKIRSYLEADLE